MILNDILKRLLIELGDMELIDKLLALPKSDLNSLLLDLFQKQAERMTPSDVVKSYQTNRFSVPSQLDPVSYHALETELLSIAQKAEIKAVLLSPCSPFGSSSAFGCVNQNKVVSAVRGVEIFPDPSNMLSIIIAEQLKSKKVDNAKPIHYCTTARVLRAQVFPNTGRHFAHFGQFCIVSSGKDSGSYACEKNYSLSIYLAIKQSLSKNTTRTFQLFYGKGTAIPMATDFLMKWQRLLRAICPKCRFRSIINKRIAIITRALTAQSSWKKTATKLR